MSMPFLGSSGGVRKNSATSVTGPKQERNIDVEPAGPAGTVARMDASAVLSSYFGFEAFRPGQREAVEAALAGRDVLGVMPTGSGKTPCYQPPPFIREQPGDLVV